MSSLNELRALFCSDGPSLVPQRDHLDELPGPDAYSAARRLSAAVARENPPPCESACPNRALCRAEALACSAFVQYTNSEPWDAAARMPTRGYYRLIFSVG